MSDLNARLLAQRIDTVLDILVAGDYHSAIHNLEILKRSFRRFLPMSLKRNPANLKRPGKSDRPHRHNRSMMSIVSQNSPLTVMLL
ncbi:Uncharacterised protein [Raoultella ornithinolytica]|nr:Uncharacterised protein [Raoultella ornithinolytica]